MRLHAFVKAHYCIGWAFYAPGDVQVNLKNRVQPDIFVVPRTAAVQAENPGWARRRRVSSLEILSDSTAATRPRPENADLYERAGIVQEHTWIVDYQEA